MSTADTRKDGVIETASATTSPDNVNSGPTAYIITGVALAVVVALAWGLGSCVGGFASAAATNDRVTRRLNTYDDYRYDDDYYFDDMDLDELERFLLD